MSRHAKAADQNLVVVGVDFTSGARTALARATQIAGPLGARLAAVHVVTEADGANLPSTGEFDAPPAPQGEDALIAAAQIAERRLVAEHGASGVETKVLTGRPHEVLAQWAERRGARLLVLGVHAPMAPHESFFLGSTSERALRVGSTPVLLARTDPSKPYGRVLAAVDLGDMSLSVLRVVARTFPDAAYDLVHFLRPATSHEVTSKERHDSFAASLAGLALSAGLAPTRTRIRVFVADAREGLLGEIRTRRPDVVAMGTHARSGVARVVIGSVADYVIHAASGVDVLVTPPAKN
jgi:nucleotide-binding universal stress UspA family protein